MRINWFDAFMSLLVIVFGSSIAIIFQYFPNWARDYNMLENYPYAIFYGAILVSILSLLGIFWASRKSAEFRHKQEGTNKTQIRIDSSDIAKMTPEQLTILEKTLDRLGANPVKGNNKKNNQD